MNRDTSWTHVKADIFWGEVAPCDHVIQIYESDEVFIDALAGFIGNGINMGECCVVIATAVHLETLKLRLESHGIRVDALIEDNRYFPLVAEDVLSTFMVDGWPDEALFMQSVSTILSLARKTNRRVRAFGEMVAILWAQGHSGATVRLEHLWNKFCSKETLCLFCAYPKAGFTNDIHSSFDHICAEHSKMISGSDMQVTDIYYKDRMSA
jgi:hypothetical protein